MHGFPAGRVRQAFRRHADQLQRERIIHFLVVPEVIGQVRAIHVFDAVKTIRPALAGLEHRKQRRMLHARLCLRVGNELLPDRRILLQVGDRILPPPAGTLQSAPLRIRSFEGFFAQEAHDLVIPQDLSRLQSHRLGFGGRGGGGLRRGSGLRWKIMLHHPARNAAISNGFVSTCAPVM